MSILDLHVLTPRELVLSALPKKVTEKPADTRHIGLRGRFPGAQRFEEFLAVRLDWFQNYRCTVPKTLRHHVSVLHPKVFC